jgi:anaerobic selenocysteine-containing dehydrogenase
LVPAVGDLVEEWMFFAGLARRMGTPLELPGGPLNTEHLPTTLDVIDSVFTGAKVPIRTIAQHEGGHIYDEINEVVAPPIPGLEGRLQFTPEGIVDELREVFAEAPKMAGRYGKDGAFSHLLICSRLKHVMNSVGHDYPSTRAHQTFNPAYVHPDDLRHLGLASGDVVEVASEDGAVAAIVEASEDVRRGVVALAHAFGGDPREEADVREVGSSTARLISNAHDYDPISGIPRQSAIPVRLRRSASKTAA